DRPSPTLPFPNVESVAVWRPLLLVHLVEPHSHRRTLKSFDTLTLGGLVYTCEALAVSSTGPRFLFYPDCAALSIIAPCHTNDSMHSGASWMLGCRAGREAGRKTSYGLASGSTASRAYLSRTAYRRRSYMSEVDCDMYERLLYAVLE